MKNLKLYEKFNESEIEIRKICKINDVRNYNIDGNGFVNVDGSVSFAFKKYNKIPIKFGRVTGNFTCRGGIFTKIPNLENCPQYIGGSFDCSINNLITLSDGPKYVGKDYICSFNYLKDVYGFPEAFVGGISIGENSICELLGLVTNKYEMVRFIKLLNDYHVIRNREHPTQKSIVIKDRLEEALNHFDIHSIKKIKFKYYEIL